MRKIRKFIRTTWIIIITSSLLFIIFFLVISVLQDFVNSPTSDLLLGLLKGLVALLLFVLGIFLVPLFYLLQPLYPYGPTIAILTGILFVTLLMTDLTLLYFEKNAEAKTIERERTIKEEEKRIEKEIERRNNIIFDILNNLYKETEKEVNKTLIPTLINELYDVYTRLHSDNMKDLVINGSSADFQNIITSIISELNRLKKLSLEAQAKGYTDDEREYTSQEIIDNVMTKEKALQILELKPDATKDDIKNAYWNLAKKYNTTQRANLEEHIKEMLEEKMKELNSAKDCLSALGLI